MFRQGDVLIEKVNQKSIKGQEVLKEDGRVVLAHGEATGHAHAIHEKMVRFFRDAEGSGWLDVKEPAVVRHEEHSPINLDPGIYKVTRQREYSPEAIRQVAD